jgi:hypothetical protein
MSDSIIEQIAVKIAALVDAVTVGNGFHQTLTAVRPKRIHMEGDINTDLTVIVEQDAEAVIEEDSNTVVIWRQGFALQALVIDSDDATAAIDTRLNQVRSDIEKKLMTGDNWQLDGMGEVLLKSAEKFIADPQVAGISVNIDVLYEVNKADPYSQA